MEKCDKKDAAKVSALYSFPYSHFLKEHNKKGG
jgi:hypothetical protein